MGLILDTSAHEEGVSGQCPDASVQNYQHKWYQIASKSNTKCGRNLYASSTARTLHCSGMRQLDLSDVHGGYVVLGGIMGREDY